MPVVHSSTPDAQPTPHSAQQSLRLTRKCFREEASQLRISDQRRLRVWTRLLTLTLYQVNSMIRKIAISTSQPRGYHGPWTLSSHLRYIKSAAAKRRLCAIKNQNALFSRLISSRALSSVDGVIIAASPCSFAMLYVGAMESRRLQSRSPRPQTQSCRVSTVQALRGEKCGGITC